MKKSNRKLKEINRSLRSEIRGLFKIKALDDFREKITSKLKSPMFQHWLYYSKRKFLSAGFGGNTDFCPNLELENFLVLIFIKLKRESSNLSDYVLIKDNYEKLILVGNFEHALNLVESIGSKYGYSFWYIEAKLSTLALLNRKDEMRLFYQKIEGTKLNEIENRDLDLIFDRTSPGSKIDRITYSLDSLKDGLSKEDAVDSYIIDFMHRFNCGETYNAQKVLSYFWQCNIIDIYNAVIRLFFTESIQITSLSKTLQDDFYLIAQSINDNRIWNYFGREDHYSQELKENYLKACDLYILGDYSAFISYYESNFVEYPWIYSLFEFYINSLINTQSISALSKHGILYRIVQSHVNCTIRGSNAINKTFYMLNHIDAIQVICLREEKKIVSFEKTRSEKIYRYFECTSFQINPFNKAKKYEHSICSSITHSHSLESINSSIPEYRNKKRTGDFYFHEKSFSKAIDIYLSITNIPIHMKDEVNNKIVLCYFYNNEILKACSFICELHFNSTLNISRVDTTRILEILEDCESPEDGHIDIPIAVHLIASQQNEEQVTSLYLDDYLDHLNVNKPSELDATDDKHIYLLHKVCNLNVLEALHTVRSIYSSSTDRLLDRMKILSKLGNKKIPEIDNEIKFLTAQYSRNLCVKNVGKGKININFDMLAEIVKDEKKVYLDSMIDIYISNKDDFLFNFEDIKNQKNTPLYNTVYEFLSAVRDVYTLDGKYGLDYQLNTKIRHNGIVPAIRSIFVSEGIICKKNDDDYLDNELFEKECKSLLWESSYSDFQSEIKALSQYIDCHIFKLKSVYMHILTNEKNDKDRLFKFPINEHDIASYLLYLDQNRTRDEYVNQALLLLKSKTNECLYVGRELISKGLPERFLLELNNLKTSLKSIHAESYISALSLVIKDMSSKLADISEWLSFSEVVGENFSLDVAIYEARVFTQTIYPKVNLNTYSTDDNKLRFDGKLLDSFVLMFILLFENATKKRKLEDSIDIAIHIKSNDNNMTISIANDYSDIDHALIKKINSEINTTEFLLKANKEKNSGLFKVKKILEIDFKCNNSIALECNDTTFTFIANFDVTHLKESSSDEDTI
jgi:hypothetical protein